MLCHCSSNRSIDGNGAESKVKLYSVMDPPSVVGRSRTKAVEDQEYFLDRGHEEVANAFSPGHRKRPGMEDTRAGGESTAERHPPFTRRGRLGSGC